MSDSFALRSLDLQMLLLGGTLAALCLLYLIMNHWLDGRWRPIPRTSTKCARG